MSVKFTKDDFISKSIKIHGDKYDYSLTEYINMRTNIKIICKKHGLFEQRPDIYLKNGCKDCFVLERGIRTFLEDVKKIHNNKYDYDLSDYINRTSKIVINCKEHGQFLQTPHKHLQGRGCPGCKGGIISNINDFIKKANDVHNNKYKYEKSNYKNSSTKIRITCKIHGDFWQKPGNHINKKYGCPTCGSKFGIKENKWLDYLGIKERQVRVGKYIVDGFDPKTNTIYEFNGDFWHGNPDLYNQNDINNVLNKTFGELYKKTINREKYLIKRGYNFVSIWENDFDIIS